MKTIYRAKKLSRWAVLLITFLVFDVHGQQRDLDKPQAISDTINIQHDTTVVRAESLMAMSLDTLRKLPNEAFKAGEYLKFDVNFGFITAGEAVMALAPAGIGGDRPRIGGHRAEAALAAPRDERVPCAIVALTRHCRSSPFGAIDNPNSPTVAVNCPITLPITPGRAISHRYLGVAPGLPARQGGRSVSGEGPFPPPPVTFL